MLSAILEKIESTKIGRKHYNLLILSGIGWLFDAMDILILSYVISAMTLTGFTNKLNASIIATANNLGLLYP